MQKHEKMLVYLHDGQWSIHEGQLTMEKNVNMLITKMGLVPVPVETVIPINLTTQ